MELCKILDWDSTFFGFRVAAIVPSRLKKNQFFEALRWMEMNNVKLAYWPSDPEDIESQICAQQNNGFLADRKTTYLKQCSTASDRATPETTDVKVEEYKGCNIVPELEELALQAGIYSRFRIDPYIPENKFFELYKIWIKRSVSKEIAAKIFVVLSEGKISGMITVGEKNGRSDIGLIAVDKSLQGKSAGMALVHAAQEWGASEGYAYAQVVTQGDNLPACRFYEKCGYRVEKVENIYHFWGCK